MHSPSTSDSEPEATAGAARVDDARAEHLERGSPRTLVLSAWALALLLTLLRADDLRGWLFETSSGSALERTMDGLVAVADHTGLVALSEGLESLRAELYGVRATPPPPPPPPVPPPEPPAQVGAVSGRVVPTPRRVLIVGASSIQFAIGQALEQQLVAFEGIETFRFGKASTGLARPEEFNWPAKLEQLLAEHTPDLVIANFGGNDAQNIPLPGNQRAPFPSDAWDKLYGERIADFVLRIRARGALAVMIGMPLMRSPAFSKKMVRLNQVTREATERAGGVFLDQWDLAAQPDGTYRERVDEGGRSRAMRLEDGIHFTDPGGRFVVARLLRRLARKVRLVPKDATLGVMERHELASQALGRPTAYLAWVPRLRPDERVPLLVLLHGAESSPDDLAERLQTELQTAAQHARIAIVAPDGGAGGWWLDSPEQPVSRYASFVRDEVLVDARASLPVSEALGIAGISMGGHGALTLALGRPGAFRSVSSISGVVDLTRAADRPALVALLGPLDRDPARWEAHSAQHLLDRAPESARGLALRLSCGASDRWVDANRMLHARAEALTIPHAYDEAPFGHEWTYWQNIVPDHVAWHAAQLHAHP
ncbi:MAG: DUF459 domain-containing protein [Polyangiales bacterium]